MNCQLDTKLQAFYTHTYGEVKSWEPFVSEYGNMFHLTFLLSSKLQIQGSRFDSPALPDFLSSSGSGTGSTQPREYNRGAT
jgi:hypothetical protein